MYILDVSCICLQCHNAIGGEFQSSTAHLSPEADSLLHRHLWDEDETGCARLGKEVVACGLRDISTLLCTYRMRT